MLKKSPLLTTCGVIAIVACGSSKSGISCGPGTKAVNGQCVVASSGGASGGTGGPGGEGGTTAGGAVSAGQAGAAGAAGDSAGAAGDGTSLGVCPNPRPIDVSEPLFTDFEAGAVGWQTYDDGTGIVEGTAVNDGPTESNAGELGDSSYAAHLQGTGFTFYGIHFTFYAWATSGCVDLSAFDGISFWAKGGTGTGTTLESTLEVNIGIPSTEGSEAGGDCVTGCYDNYNVQAVLTEEWQEYSFDWTQFRQRGWGTPVVFTKEAVYTIDFTSTGDFDWWVDNIAFVPH